MKDSGHLVRLAVVFAVGIALFLTVRQIMIPKDFGKLGHYRPGALADIAAKPAVFAGRAVCEGCHDDVAKVKHEGKHANLSCEACHGPALAHTQDPSVNVLKPDPKVLCVRCHEADPARPKSFPQVVSKDHAGDVSCAECHKPHSPVPGAN